MFIVTDEVECLFNLLDDCLEHVTIFEASVATWESQALPDTSPGEDSASCDDLAYSKSALWL